MLVKIDVYRRTGEVMLWMETRHGFKPIMELPSMDDMKEFAEMLLDVYYRRNREEYRVREISENIIKQALGDNTNLLKEESNE